jgi:hypothetical protein
MFGSEMLDIAIGMIFIYLLLSLICSAVNELLERQMKNRATDLERGLRELLNDPNGSGLVKEVYNHGMVYGLFKGDYDPNAIDKSNLPSYIPSRNFALAILGILVPDASAGTTPVENFRAAITKIDNARVKTALAAMLSAAGTDLEKFRQDIENWFNGTMDRVSGWYKRRSQLIVFSLGFLAAAIMNVNSLSIANDLWVHKAERDAMVSAAQGYLAAHSPKEQIAADQGLQANIKNFQSYGLPVGWNIEKRHDSKGWILFGVISLLGWFITAAAVSLGAPFWFDMLNKLVVVRSTIKPHEKSQEEKSKS